MKRTPIAIVLVAFLLASAGHAQVDRSKKPSPGPAPKAAFPAFYEDALPNGLKVVVVTNTSEPLVTFRLLIKSGAEYEGKVNGIQSLVSDLLTKGTKTRTSLAFATEADNLGIDISAGGSDDAMYVTASGLKKHMDKMLDLMTDALLNPVFPDEELEKSRKQTISGLTSEKKDPTALSGRLRITIGYNEHPYSNFATEAEIKAITRADLVRFHQTSYIPNNAALAIVGDVKPKEIMPMMKKYFSAWQQGPVPTRAFPAQKPLVGRTVHMVDLGSTQTQTELSILTTGIRRNDPDWIPFSLLNSILGGGFSGRLFQNLREKHGFTYGAYSDVDGRRDCGLFAAGAGVRRVATDSAVTQILLEMKRLQDTLVTMEELEMHQRYASGRFLLSLENPATTASRLQDIDLYGLPKDYYKTYVTKLMRVTPQDLQRLARKYLSTENVAITAVGDASVIAAGLEQFGTVKMYDTDMNPAALPVTLPLDIDTETLLRKHFDAMGGLDKLLAIEDRITESDISMNFGPQAVDGTVYSVSKLPNKKYEKMTIAFGQQMMEQEEWNDGVSKKASVPMQGVKTLEGDELAEALEEDQFNELARWKELGYTPNVTAKKTVDGKPVYVLEVKRKHGTVTYLIGAEDFLLFGQERVQPGAMGEGVVVLRYSDYRKTDGIMLPYAMTVDAGRMSMEFTVKSYKQNSNVSDDTFKKQ